MLETTSVAESTISWKMLEISEEGKGGKGNLEGRTCTASLLRPAQIQDATTLTDFVEIFKLTEGLYVISLLGSSHNHIATFELR